MVKQLSIEQEGTVVEALGNAMFRVELENGLIPSLARCVCTISRFCLATKSSWKCLPMI